MKMTRQETILEIIGAKRIGTQQQLARELQRRGIIATQSSVSRDIVALGLTKLNGTYMAPRPALAGSSVIEIDTAGDNLIIIKTEIGQASATALTIDRAKIDEIIGTVAGDDTLFVAVKNVEAQRAARKRIVELLAPPPRRAIAARKRAARSNARAV